MMKKKALMFLVLFAVLPVEAHALFTDTAIAGLWYAKDTAYQAFMKLRVVQQIRMLKQNYDSSVRYYRMFKRMNSGKGLLHNVASQLKTAGEQMARDLEAQIDRDFINTYNTDTEVDRFFRRIDKKIESSMRYAGDGLGNIISNLDTGKRIAENANGLSPKDAANLTAKAGGLQLQMMVQLHEDNLRAMDLQAARLAVENRKEKQRSDMLRSVQESVQRRVPKKEAGPRYGRRHSAPRRRWGRGGGR